MQTTPQHQEQIQLQNEEEQTIKKPEIIKEVIKTDYETAKEVAAEVKKIKRYSEMGNNIITELAKYDKKSFVKQDLKNFLTGAEEYVNEQNSQLTAIRQKAGELSQSVYAIEDIQRIYSLIFESSKDVSDLTASLTIIKKAMENIKDSTDILAIADDFSKAYDNLKQISYALSFTYDRIDFLLDKDSQADSLRFYSRQYGDYNGVYSSVSAKLNALTEKSESLEKKLTNYAKRVRMSSGNGLISIDWEGKKLNALNKQRLELTEGYEQLDTSCSLIVKNVTTIIENLINSDSELADYLITLLPKLKTNVETVEPKYKALADALNKYNEEAKSMTADLQTLIELMNRLY